MEKLRILLTNNTLRLRAGSELVTFELASKFKKLGHFPVVYSTDLGPIAEDLNKNCVPVLSDLSEPAFVPDVIHGHHHLDAMTAMLRFPDTPAVYVCQGWIPHQERPPVFPNVQRYVAVSELTAERVLTTSGVDSRRLVIVPNSVDLDRFRKRQIGPVPRTAAVFNNSVGPGPFLDQITAACGEAGVESLDVIGMRSGKSIARPEDVLPKYDLVFAVGRSAIEAMATGCAVIVASPDGLAGMVGPANVERWSQHNFALALLQKERLTQACLVEEIRKYRADHVDQACEYIRLNRNLDRVVDTYLDLYRGVISEWRESGAPDHVFRERQWKCASSYLAGLSIELKNVQALRTQSSEAKSKLEQLRAEIASARGDLEAVQARLSRSLGPSTP